MESFLFRLASTGIRFLCPLAILALSSPAMMGTYYLFVTYFTFIVFLIALELAIPFSGRYLRSATEVWRRRVFDSFVISQLALSFVLAIPATIVYFCAAPMRPALVALFAVAVVSEACVNEVGRFFWNIGETHVASRRDFIRSVVFVLAVIGAVVVNDAVVSYVSLGVIALCNGIILSREMRAWGAAGIAISLLRYSRPRYLRLLFQHVRHATRESLPQVLHVQIMSVQPLLERTFIENRLGLGQVAAYSFQYSVIQSAASLFLLPVIASARRAIFAANAPAELAHAHRISLALLGRIVAISSALAFVAHFAVPIIATLLRKGIASTVSVLVAALISSCVATFASAIAPLYARRERVVRANLAAMVAFVPMGLLLLPVFSGFAGSEAGVVTVIMATALAQAAVRVLYLIGW